LAANGSIFALADLALLPGDRMFWFRAFWSCSSLVATEISSCYLPADRRRRLAMRASPQISHAMTHPHADCGLLYRQILANVMTDRLGDCFANRCQRRRFVEHYLPPSHIKNIVPALSAITAIN
jgi:hypothetical protein